MKRLLVVTSLGLLIGCGGEPEQATFNRVQGLADLEDTVSVVDIFPDDNATDVSVDTKVIIKFSDKIDFGSVNSFRFRVEDEFGIPAPGKILINTEGNQLEFRPQKGSVKRALKPSTNYTVHARYIRNKYRHLIAPYHWRFRTQKEVPTTGSFKIDQNKIEPKAEWIFPGNHITIAFNQNVALPTAGDDNNPYCSRVQWAEAFQIVVIRLFGNNGDTEVYPVGGKVCIDSGNRRRMRFIPDSDFPLFPELSVVDIEIRPTDGLVSESGHEKLQTGIHLTKMVTPDPTTVVNLFFGGYFSE